MTSTTDTKTTQAMTMGLVGLGRMGAGIRDRLKRDGHEVTGYDRDPALSDVASLTALVESLDAPRVVWVMVPAGDPTEQTLTALAGLLAKGDTIVEGGNSYYRDSIRRAEEMAGQGIDYVDAGVSGGIWGLREGFCIMAGGPDEAVGRVAPLFQSLVAEGGWAHVGPAGAGHFVKMVHNGIEYGMLQSYAEGFELLHAYDTPIDLKQVASLWNHGSVVRSWLLELAELAFENDAELSGIQGYVDDSGEGRWTVLDAVDRAVPAGVIAQSLFARFTSRQEDSFAMRVIAALRNEFGGHRVKET
jgi:6-phosphogluconate dehydrogenase